MTGPPFRRPFVAAAARAVLLLLALAGHVAGAQPLARDTVGSAAPETFVHESWTVRDGLPVNSVNALLQSRDGYVWIATFDGLARFDGVRFTVYSSANSPGLPSNRIIGLHEARDGTLWLRTETSQLVRFRDGAFVAFGPERGLSGRVSTLYEDPGGTLWVGTTQGLGAIRGERFVAVARETIRGEVQSVVRRTDGSIWAGTLAGELFRVDVSTGRATLAWQEHGAQQRSIMALYEDPRHALWLGTNYGVRLWSDATGTAQPLLDHGEVLRFLASPRTGDVWALLVNNVFRIAGDRPAPVLARLDMLTRPELLLTDDAGRMLYTSGPELHREGRRVYSLVTDSGAPPVQRETITALVLDREGSLWLGTRGTGLHRLKPALFSVYGRAEGLASANVYSVHEDRGGAIWIGTLDGGASRLANGHIERMPDLPSGISFLSDHTDRLWAGVGEHGLRVCDSIGRHCARPSPDPIGDNRVFAMHEDAGGALWFGSDTGLFRLTGRQWQRFGRPDGAPSAPVRVFQTTRDGALWMGTNGGGLARYHDGRFTRVTTADGLPLDLVRSLHEDADGWLWVGTEGRGLARLDPRAWREHPPNGTTRAIVRIATSDGLFDDVVHQILEDDAGRLWMSTNRGIFWVARRELLDFAAGRTTRIHSTGYTERDGLRNREANGGSQPAGMKARDGRLWFPTQDGVAVVDPRRVEGNRVAPNVVVEQVVAGGAARRPTHAPLALGTAQRDLEIAYTALSFLAPANVRFRYRLEPYDRDWIDAGARRTAFYTRVPPGRYTFRVIASNNDGVWNTRGAAITLDLAPHLWETNAFRLLVALLLGALAAGAVSWRVRSLRARAEELTRVVNERTAELQALNRTQSRFFANVSHEFRTPLTLILGPLRDLSERHRDVLPDALAPQVDMMTRNAQRLLRLVNQVLDVARVESGTLTLAAEPRDLVELAAGTTRAFAPLAERRRIALAFTPEVERLAVDVDADQMEKVLLNLLSNAFKFTEPGGRVEVHVRRDGGDGGRAVVEVRDTGIGITPEQLPRVFERFYQADGSATRRHEGTGIGLSLVRELVELHGGTVTAESRVGEGSTFVVRLPVRPGHAPPRSAGVADAARRPATDLHLSDVPGAAVEASGRTSDDDADRTTVLVVDDNADIRAYVRSVLAPRFRVLEAGDGEEGLERARDALPDLVIADVMMPRRDGFALARALRDDPATDCIPTILLTARAGADAEVEGLGTGADDFITKPFDAQVLEARVAGLIANRRRLRDRFRQDGVPAPESPEPSTPPPVPRSELEVRLRAVVEANLTEPDFNPEALASQAGLSYGQLYRRLAAELDATPSQFIRTVRVERAAELLRRGAGSVTEVAYSVGFNSLSHFHKCFRERFGTSPAAATRTIP